MSLLYILKAKAINDSIPGEPGVLLAVHADHVHHPLHPALHPGGALLAAAGPDYQGHYHHNYHHTNDHDQVTLITPLRRRLATPSLYHPSHTGSLSASYLAVIIMKSNP